MIICSAFLSLCARTCILHIFPLLYSFCLSSVIKFSGFPYLNKVVIVEEHFGLGLWLFRCCGRGGFNAFSVVDGVVVLRGEFYHPHRLFYATYTSFQNMICSQVYATIMK